MLECTYFDQIQIKCNVSRCSACTWFFVVAGLVHASDEELQTDDGVDDDDEEYQQSDVEQGNHGLHDGVQHDL